MSDAQPNIVVFFWDNFGWGELGCYGGGVLRGAPTPRIDALACEGGSQAWCRGLRPTRHHQLGRVGPRPWLYRRAGSGRLSPRCRDRQRDCLGPVRDLHRSAVRPVGGKIGLGPDAQSVGPLLAPDTSMVLAWAGEPVARATLDAFTKPDSQRLVLRFNTVEHGAILEAA